MGRDDQRGLPTAPMAMGCVVWKKSDVAVLRCPQTIKVRSADMNIQLRTVYRIMRNMRKELRESENIALCEM